MMMRLLKSMGFAFQGIYYLLRKERNFQWHLVALASVTIAGFYCEISRIEWISILLISALVISLEAINTAIEKLCDLYSLAQDARIKHIKDISAAAVLIASGIALLIGALIFLKGFWR
jgi:diacylglycerol kinase